MDFRRIRNGDDLAAYLPCAPELVADRIAGDTSSFLYHAIPKRNPHRGVRDVWECESPIISQALKAFSQRFDEFARVYIVGFPHAAAHGYLKACSIRTNAAVHVGSQRLLHADIRDFFPGITTERLARFLVSIGLQAAGAQAIARFATIDDKLPLGFPSSPVLANALCLELDRDLAELATKHGSSYSRYADDLAFSTRGADLPSPNEVEEVVGVHGFALAPEKTSMRKRGQAYYVTGLSVSENDRPRAPAALKRRLRQELHYIDRFGLYEHLGARYATYRSGINYIGGALRFLHSIEPELARGMRTRWRAALDKTGAIESYESRSKAGPATVSLFFDESDFVVQGRRVLLLGCVAIEDVGIVRAQVIRFLDDKRAHPFNAGDQSKLDDKGLHWADLHPDLRTEVVGLLARLPIRGYVAYATVPSDTEYTNVYKSLLAAILKRRLVALDGQDVTLSLEQNSRLTRRDLDAAISAAEPPVNTMDAKAKGPRSITLEVKGKLEEPCLALADGILAVFGEFVKKPPSKDPSKPEQHDSRFEHLRTKLRVVQSLDDGRVYTRRDVLPRL